MNNPAQTPPSRPLDALHLDQRVVFRLTPPLKAAWEQLCRDRGARSGDLLRQLVERETGTLASVTPPGPVADDEAVAMVRVWPGLTRAQRDALNACALSAGYASASAFAAAVLRHWLGGHPEFSPPEVDALRRSSGQIAMAGRNLNQIARALNSWRVVENATLTVQVGQLASAFRDHVRMVSALLDANRRRWRDSRPTEDA